jgi:hypothetical protein
LQNAHIFFAATFLEICDASHISKGHRPDLKQLLLILTMAADGNVPVAFRCTDGNASDSRTHIETWKLALLVQALIERELRAAMKREKIARLPLYPEQRLCAHPATEQILSLFSFAERHQLTHDGKIVQVFDVE